MVYQRVLPMNRCLNVGDRIARGNGMFFAILEADGQLRVYRGSCPDARARRAVASSARRPRRTLFRAGANRRQFLHLPRRRPGRQRGLALGHPDDGRRRPVPCPAARRWRVLRLQGRRPDDARGQGVALRRRRSGRRIDEIEPWTTSWAALAGAARPADLYRETVSNSSDAEPDQHDQRLGIGVGQRLLVRRTGCRARWRRPASRARCRWSARQSGHVGRRRPAYIRNGADTSAKLGLQCAGRGAAQFGDDVRGVGDPLLGHRALHPARQSSRWHRAAQVGGSVDGSYSGSNCHDLSVALTTYDPNPARQLTISRPLTPMPSISGGQATQHPSGARSVPLSRGARRADGARRRCYSCANMSLDHSLPSPTGPADGRSTAASRSTPRC